MKLYKKDDILSDFLKDELSLFCDDGVSAGIFHGGTVIGGGWNMFFERFDEKSGVSEEEYINAETWLNAAAELAELDPEPSQCWRHFQFLHLQHYCQHLIRRYDAEFALHMSLLSFHEDHRGGTIARELISQIVEHVHEAGGVVTTVGNFPAFPRFWMKEFPNTVIEDYVKYSKLELTINKEKVFKNLEKLDGISFLSVVEK